RCLAHCVLLPFYHTCTAHHQHLSSFPTRRSSDLHRHEPPHPTRLRRPRPCRRRSERRRGRERAGRDRSVRMRCTSRRQPSAPRRSEEHTSELQSRENLVCRLLLEKKKNTTISSGY